MSEEPDNKSSQEQSAFLRQVDAQAKQKLKARRNANQGVWFGLGMMGLIGWSVVIPTMLGAWFGMWLDKHYPGVHPWTLTMLIAGLALGCFNAWHWVDMQDKKMRDNNE